ncbi:MAG: NAD-dependent deacylase [Prevotellaceae bacterium]|jgi:NAD-dependent deacetylase|nr:NAD-dependent deacylase [Prevotellaceae bacterium]
MKKLAVLTGAGISAESGISTFRDSDGLWEQHNVMDVASIDGWYKNPKLVLDFYNERRKQLATVEPNAAHKILYELEEHFNVCIITQNVDNLHERAGSTNIIHLHGELTKVRSVADEDTVYDIGYKPVNLGDTDKHGSQLRPHIVWFGEAVPMLNVAAGNVSQADIIAIIGTSLNVYPAAGLVNYKRNSVPVFLINPNDVNAFYIQNLTVIKQKATTGVAEMRDILVNGKRI